jgi:hypothetical protein
LTEAIPNPKHYGLNTTERYIFISCITYGGKVYILRFVVQEIRKFEFIIQLVAKGLPWPLGDFQNERSFFSIENLCFVIRELLNNATIPSGVYQVADDESLSKINIAY